MTKKLLMIIVVFLCASCTSLPQYTWQDTRTPAREDASLDLEECRDFASRQYRPGMPSGEEYLRTQEDDSPLAETTTSGEWRPDRAPGQTISVHALPRHDVPAEYTGFPGELDYHPNYLDDILEKCMRDRGWEYSEIIDK